MPGSDLPSVWQHFVQRSAWNVWNVRQKVSQTFCDRYNLCFDPLSASLLHMWYCHYPVVKFRSVLLLQTDIQHGNDHPLNSGSSNWELFFSLSRILVLIAPRTADHKTEDRSSRWGWTDFWWLYEQQLLDHAKRSKTAWSRMTSAYTGRWSFFNRGIGCWDMGKIRRASIAGKGFSHFSWFRVISRLIYRIQSKVGVFHSFWSKA